MSSRIAWIGAFVLAALSYVTYYPGLKIGFYLDDYVYLERAGRTQWSNALAQIFDPRLQTQWYRPLQAIQFFLQYQLFGGDANVYHYVNMTFHVLNVLLLYAIVLRLSQRWLIGLGCAFFYATFSVYPSGVNWVGIVDPLNTIFYLLSVWFWLVYLRRPRWQYYALAFFAFVLALLSKQISITVPPLLFMIEWWSTRQPFDLLSAVRRYALFVAAAVGFSLLQYLTQSTHTFASVFGWQFGASMAYILLQYLVLVFFPWGSFPSIDLNQVQVGAAVTYAWVAVAVLAYAYVTWRMRSRALLVLAAFTLMNLLPVLPFPFIENRYLYLPIAAAALVLALLLYQARRTVGTRAGFALASAVILALLAVGNGFAINDSALSAAEWARQLRVPFRDIAREHPTLPSNTLLYFIDPITPTTGGLSGMAMVQYGSGVWVKNWTEYADLARYDHAYVYYFDETRRPIEVPAQKDVSTRTSLAAPVDFQGGIRFTGYEVPRVKVTRGAPLVLILYWQATTKIDRDYTMFAHLLASDGTVLASYESQPRKGKMPTTSWDTDHYVADSILIPVGAQAPIESGCRIELGWYDSATHQRIAVVGAGGKTQGDTIVIRPFDVID